MAPWQPQERAKAMQLVVRGMRRQVHLGRPEQSVGFSGPYEPKRGEGVSGVGLTQGLCSQNAGQVGADNLVDTIFERLQEESKLKIPKRFIEVDNREAVHIGDLNKNSEEIKLAGAQFNKDIFQDATIREEVVVRIL